MISKEQASAMVMEFEKAQVAEFDRMVEDFCENKLAPEIESLAKAGKRGMQCPCSIKIATKIANYLRKENYAVNLRSYDNEQEIIQIWW